MESQDVLTPNAQEINEEDSYPDLSSEAIDKYVELDEQVMTNFKKGNLPNINVPEKIVICLDVCYDDPNSLYRLGDGTTYTPINMLKRVLDFFIHSKHAINKKTEFALIALKDTDPYILHDFTNSVREIINVIDFVDSEDSTKENFEFLKILKVLEDMDVCMPEYAQSERLPSPAYIVRMVVLYARSNCIPIIHQDHDYLNFLKKHPYFYIDILFTHEDDCALHKCEDVYDALQDLDNGYSYVFEVSRNATKIHDCIAKLLAHPLQRPLQKHTDYTFPSRY